MVLEVDEELDVEDELDVDEELDVEDEVVVGRGGGVVAVSPRARPRKEAI